METLQPGTRVTILDPIHRDCGKECLLVACAGGLHVVGLEDGFALGVFFEDVWAVSQSDLETSLYSPVSVKYRGLGTGGWQ